MRPDCARRANRRNSVIPTVAGRAVAQSRPAPCPDKTPPFPGRSPLRPRTTLALVVFKRSFFRARRRQHSLPVSLTSPAGTESATHVGAVHEHANATGAVSAHGGSSHDRPARRSTRNAGNADGG